MTKKNLSSPVIIFFAQKLFIFEVARLTKIGVAHGTVKTVFVVALSTDGQVEAVEDLSVAQIASELRIQHRHVLMMFHGETLKQAEILLEMLP